MCMNNYMIFPITISIKINVPFFSLFFATTQSSTNLKHNFLLLIIVVVVVITHRIYKKNTIPQFKLHFNCITRLNFIVCCVSMFCCRFPMFIFSLSFFFILIETTKIQHTILLWGWKSDSNWIKLEQKG